MSYDDTTPPHRVIDIAEPAAADPAPPPPRGRPDLHPVAMLHWPGFTIPGSGTPGTDDRGLLARLLLRSSERSR